MRVRRWMERQRDRCSFGVAGTHGAASRGGTSHADKQGESNIRGEVEAKL